MKVDKIKYTEVPDERFPGRMILIAESDGVTRYASFVGRRYRAVDAITAAFDAIPEASS